MNTRMNAEKMTAWRKNRPVECCRQPENLTYTFLEKTSEAPARSIDTCVCGRRHMMAHFEQPTYMTEVNALG